MPAAAPTDRYVVVGAHKDHIGVNRRGDVYAGANDNAGGVAGVLEIAQALRTRYPQGLKAHIIFMCFSGEELGLLGSEHYTDHPVVPTADGQTKAIQLTQINGMVNLDVIAVGHPDKLGIDDGEREGPRAVLSRRVLGSLAAGQSFQPVFKPFPADHLHGLKLPPWASSDHASFRRKGVWAVIYYGEPAMSRTLHTTDDTIPARDRYSKKPIDRFSPELLVRVASVGLETAVTLAQTGKPPR
jgi:Zn-dependent M28 family amino/carboxypeptidase